MAASSVPVEQESYIDFAQFNFDDFNGYCRIFNLWDNIRKGIIINQNLFYYNICPYTIIRIRENLEFRDYFLREVETILKKYEEQFPGDKNLFHVIREFQNQAWALKQPCLFSMMLSARIPVDFNNREVVELVQDYYQFDKTGKYADLIKDYKEYLLEDFLYDVPGDLRMANRDFFDVHIEEVFARLDNEEHPHSISSGHLISILLNDGSYETFLMLMYEAVYRKKFQFIEIGAKKAIKTRNLALVKSVFDPETGVYSVADEEIREIFEVNYYKGGKDIYDYCKNLWEYELDKLTHKKILDSAALAGDFQMFKFLFDSSKIADYDSLSSRASIGGSVEIFSKVEDTMIQKRKVPRNVRRTLENCFIGNCIELILWLLNQSSFKSLYKKKLIEDIVFFDTSSKAAIGNNRYIYKFIDPSGKLRKIIAQGEKVEVSKNKPKIRKPKVVTHENDSEDSD